MKLKRVVLNGRKNCREICPNTSFVRNLLMLCHVTEPVLERIKLTAVWKLISDENILPIGPIIGGSREDAWTAAGKWITE